MKSIYLALAGLLLFLPVNAGAVSFDQNVLKATLQIQIYDSYTGNVIGWGTGISMGWTILTNYHVAKQALADPGRYKLFGCITYAINAEPDCKHQLSITPVLFGQNTGGPHYDPGRDLALLYLDKVRIGNEWKSYMDLPISEFGLTTVDLSSYTKKYEDMHEGDTVYSIGYPDYGSGRAIQVDGSVLWFVPDQRSGFPLAVSDFKISHGNSGGPVFNADGELVGVTVACYHDKNEKCYIGLFIPLPTIHWWYTSTTGTEVFTWEGKSSYASIPGKTLSAALCMLRKNAHYNPAVSKETCTCDAGWTKSIQGGDCDIHIGISLSPKSEQSSEPNISPQESRAPLPQTQIQPTEWDNALRCKAGRGEHAIWTGVIDANGNAVCDCEKGYQYNGTICVIIPSKAPVEVKKVLPKQTASSEAATSAPKVSTSTIIPVLKVTDEVPKQKRGIWAWLLGLFGL